MLGSLWGFTLLFRDRVWCVNGGKGLTSSMDSTLYWGHVFYVYSGIFMLAREIIDLAINVNVKIQGLLCGVITRS